MTRNEQYARGWVSSLRWETSIPVCNKPKVSNSLSVSVSIRVWSLSVTWVEQDVRNSSPWVKYPTLLRASKDSLQPNTMAISEATYRLVQGYFACQDLGAQTLRGVAEPVHVYHVLQESGATSRLDVAAARGLTPLVGRESEVTLLLERWEQAKAGQGHVVLLTGDAGIGKIRLVQMLKEHVANEPHMRWECRSSAYFENTALFPLTDLFQRLLQFASRGYP